MTEAIIDYTTELWKEVLDFPRYKISTFGRLLGCGKNNWKNKGILRPQYDEKGYLRVRLYNEGGVKTLKVHRLVAREFIENPLNKPHVNHIDGKRDNNILSNLEWVTMSENSLHSIHVLKTKKVPDWRLRNK